MKQSLKIEIPIDKLPSQRWVQDYIYDKYELDDVLNQKDEKLAFFLLMGNPEFFSFIERVVEKYVLEFCVDDYWEDESLAKFPIFESVLSKSEEGKSILSKIQKRLKKEESRKVREEKSRERDYIEYLKGKGYTVSQTGFSE